MNEGKQWIAAIYCNLRLASIFFETVTMQQCLNGMKFAVIVTIKCLIDLQ